jgi:hypothetical protein
LQFRSTLIAALAVLGAACAAPAAPPELTLDFHALLFSSDELRRLQSGEHDVEPSMDAPLTTWSATTLGSPHPDIVNAQVRIAVPESMRRRTTVVVLRQEWKIGRHAGGEASAQWGEPSQRASLPLDLVPGNTVSVSLPLAVGDVVRRETRAGRVPWRLAVRVELRDTATMQTLAMAKGVLPITTGNRNQETGHSVRQGTADTGQNRTK